MKKSNQSLTFDFFAIFAAVVFAAFFGVQNSVYAQNSSNSQLLVSNLHTVNITTSSAQILWTTNLLADSSAGYAFSGASYIFSDRRCDNGGYVLEHCIYLTGLAPAASYSYKAMSHDQSYYVNGYNIYNTAYSEGVFTTLALSSDAGIYTQTSSLIFTTTESSTATTTSITTNYVSSSDATTNIDQISTATTTLYYQTSTSSNIINQNVYTAPTSTIIFQSSGIISGSVQNENFQTLSILEGFIYAQDIKSGNYFGTAFKNGSFSLSVPSGSYQLGIKLPPDSSYNYPEPRIISVSGGITTTANIILLSGSAVISGTIIDETGAVITNVPVKVFASKNGVWQSGEFNSATGNYKISVPAGEWLIGAQVDSASGFSAPVGDILVNAVKGAAISRNIVFKRSAGIVSGKVLKPDNSPFNGALVEIADKSYLGTGASDKISNYAFSAKIYTDAGGSYSFRLPAGNYFIRAFSSSSGRFLNPEEKQFAVSAGATVSVDLLFRNFDRKISGRVILNNQDIQAFVWAWSDKGGYREMETDSLGNYSLSVKSGEIWRLAAAKEIGQKPYRSSEISLAVGEQDIVQDLNLSPLDFSLPKSATKQADAASFIDVSLSNGTAVSMPSNAVAATGNVSVSITPEISVPSQGATKVMGAAYNIEARDVTGKTISQINKQIIIELPYYDEDLKRFGVAEDNLNIAYWDESAGVWRELNNAVIDKKRKVITALVDHLTRFAIVAAADIIPPAGPANAAAVPGAVGEIIISWTNPASDFHHVKIYRSIQKGVTGQAVFNDVVVSERRDRGLAAGVTYYYTVRAIDPAGNESTNINQVSATASAGGLKISSFARNLKLGSQGDDVRLLQQILIEQNVYPENLVTGYFGLLTRTAAARFQEKYFDEILKPLDLIKGTGFIGSASRAKLNKIISGQ